MPIAALFSIPNAAACAAFAAAESARTTIAAAAMLHCALVGSK